MRRGRKPKIERNASFLWDWTNARHGDRQVVADKYGFKDLRNAAVIAHRLRKHGTTTQAPPIDKRA